MEQTSKLTQAVTAYKAGDTYSFTALYEESSKYIYSCIYKVINGNDNAQDIISDIMQDTYVEVSKSVWQLSDDNKFLSWAGMIATRKCYAYLKTNKKYVLLNDDDDTFENISDSDAIIPEEIMEDREKQRLIRNIIDNELTEMQKLCIIAYYYNEMKQSEIAQQFNIPENTVKTNLSRAKAKIKEQVLDLEKNQGTRLYTFTPLLLLLFREEVKAAFVPANITNAVFGAVNSSLAASAATYSANTAQQAAYVQQTAYTQQGANMAQQTAYTQQGANMAQQTVYTQGANATQATIGTTVKTATATKGIAGKIAVMSVKAKLISAVAAVAVVGVAGKAVMDNVNAQNAEYAMNEELATEEETLETAEEVISEIQTQTIEDEEPEQITDVEISDSERESLLILAKYVTQTKWGEDIASGYTLTSDSDLITHFIWSLSWDASCGHPEYEAYIPEFSGNLEYYDISFTLDSIKDYARKVFGTDINDLSGDYKTWFYYENNVYIPIGAQYGTHDVCEVTGVDKIATDTYLVIGDETFAIYDDCDDIVTYTGSYHFEMTVVKNDNSPFGYTFQSITYEPEELLLENAVTYEDILLYPSSYSEYYPSGTDMNNLYFATDDIDGDGQDELLIAYNEGVFYSEDAHPNRIVNILTMKDGKVADFDGDAIYEGLAVWSIYDNGELLTETNIGSDETHFYNIYTGEYWEGCTAALDNGGTSAADRSGIIFTLTPDGSVDIRGNEAKTLYNEICQGERQYLAWHKATSENIEKYLY